MARSEAGRGSRGRAFGEYLLRNGLLGREALRQAADTQRVLGGRLDTVLLDLGLLEEGDLLQALGRFRSTRPVSGHELASASPTVARLISPRVAIRLEVVPFRLEGRTLSIATLDPSDLLVEDELAQLTDCMVASFVTLEIRLYETLARLYGVEPPIQVATVLRRLQESQGAESGPDRRPADGERRAPGARPPLSSVGGPLSAALAATQPERPLMLEISQEELEQFPSLGGGPRSEDEVQGRPAAGAGAPSADTLLERATDALQHAEMREDIGDAVLAFCTPILERCLLLAVRGDRIVGWRGVGASLRPQAVKELSLPVSEPSAFAGMGGGNGLWLGPLPRAASSDVLARALGGARPAECIILPLVVRGKTVAFLYGDNADRTLTGVPVSHLRRLAAKAGLAFQIYLLRSKIRHL